VNLPFAFLALLVVLLTVLFLVFLKMMAAERDRWKADLNTHRADLSTMTDDERKLRDAKIDGDPN